MTTYHFVISYIHYCSSGVLTRSECNSVWQLIVIAALLLLASATLIVLRIYSVPARRDPAA